MELEKLLENDRITVLSPKNVSQALYQRNKQQKCNLKNCWANKFSKNTISIQFNFLLICPSLPPLAFAAIFISPFHVLYSYLYMLVVLTV